MLFKVFVYFSFHSSLKEKHRFSSIAPSPSNWPTSKSAIPAFDLKMTSWIESTKTIDLILLTEDYSQFQLGFLSSVPRVLKPLRQKGLSVRNCFFPPFSINFLIEWNFRLGIYFCLQKYLKVQLGGGQRGGDGDQGSCHIQVTFKRLKLLLKTNFILSHLSQTKCQHLNHVLNSPETVQSSSER